MINLIRFTIISREGMMNRIRNFLFCSDMLLDSSEKQCQPDDPDNKVEKPLPGKKWTYHEVAHTQQYEHTCKPLLFCPEMRGWFYNPGFRQRTSI